MVDNPEGETYADIAARHGRSEAHVRNVWARRPQWPGPIGRRGRHLIFDPAAVDEAVTDHIGRPAVHLEPHRLYTAKEIEAATGITAATIRADRAKGRWPAPDDTSSRAHRWKGETVTQALAGRRPYRKAAD
ncbi:helix-turn-helix transcriptional regulator [Streptomyces sp. NPDC057806]|uniref:helix-turn-helix transcriptional regulator n=1 Tax=Streptomyces sp. NPDC057806 TaxID=3346255 RepID=UPI00368B0B68